MQDIISKRRETCRVCESSNVEDVFSLGNFALSDFLKEASEVRPKAPLTLMECRECGLIQLRDTVLGDILYARQYWYKSGINEVIVNDLKDIVQTGIAIAGLKEGDIVLDLGANDGTLLSFVPSAYYRIGCEPAKNLIPELEKHCDETIADFWDASYMDGRKAKLITAVGMFYDMEDPNTFVRHCKESLAEDGLMIAQLMCLENMLSQNDVGNICHEHIEYYPFRAIERLFKQNGLTITFVEINAINGSSYRLFIRHSSETTKAVMMEEPSVDLFRFQAAIEKNKMDTVNAVRELVAQGKKIYGYGASTKGNTILQYYGLTKDDIIAIADRNPEKIGKFTVETGIPIVSEEEARKNADYFLVLPYAFRGIFLEREKEWHEHGGKFILATPQFEII